MEFSSSKLKVPKPRANSKNKDFSLYKQKKREIKESLKSNEILRLKQVDDTNDLKRTELNRLCKQILGDNEVNSDEMPWYWNDIFKNSIKDLLIAVENSKIQEISLDSTPDTEDIFAFDGFNNEIENALSLYLNQLEIKEWTGNVVNSKKSLTNKKRTQKLKSRFLKASKDEVEEHKEVSFNEEKPIINNSLLLSSIDKRIDSLPKEVVDFKPLIKNKINWWFSKYVIQINS